jgi:transcriptional regulator with XRE-family HTH domain
MDSAELSKQVRAARQAKGWTFHRLAQELWAADYDVTPNKLWRLEGRPPKKPDEVLILWLEKVLEAELLGPDEKRLVVFGDVLILLNEIIRHRRNGDAPPEKPASRQMRLIYEKMLEAMGE